MYLSFEFVPHNDYYTTSTLITLIFIRGFLVIVGIHLVMGGLMNRYLGELLTGGRYSSCYGGDY